MKDVIHHQHRLEHHEVEQQRSACKKNESDGLRFEHSFLRGVGLTFSHLAEDGLVQTQRIQFRNHELPPTILEWNGLVDVKFESKTFPLQHTQRRARVGRKRLLGHTFR